MAENETLSGSVKETGSFESIEQLISYAKVDGKFHIAEAEEKSELPEDIQKQKKEKRKRRRRRWLLAIGRLFVLLLVLLLSVAALLLGVVGVICKGPSPAMRDKLVSTMMETSAAKFVAGIYLTDEEIQAILDGNKLVEFTDVTEPVEEFVPPAENVDIKDIEIVDVTGPTFRGKMMIVQDPSRVQLATLKEYNTEAGGKRVEEFVKEAGAIAGINGAGFADEGGVGDGGTPIGIVIHNSQMVYGSNGMVGDVIGFDQDNHLIVGRMSGKEAMEKNLRDAVSFGPVLVVNGNAAEVTGSGGGLNPRTAIGQRADGAVLLLVIDGRQAHSIGASYEDLVNVMLEFGAINAANLDGGSSSLMVYEDEIITICASLYGSRKIPTAFIVK
ncbi:MAG: phosphodiester glycosidase family protein [Oscillospiraceae bacterium]|nr:phosphodiester glycosidase family protein [Oscillospiraceae bacterium]